MSGTTSCPTPDNLHRFLLGQVDEVEAALVQDHLSGCDQCLDTMAHLRSDDTLVVAMRAQAQAAADPDEAVVEKLVHQLTQVTLLTLILDFFEGEIARKSNVDGVGIADGRCSEDLVS
jgi:hypothetical protein